MMRSRTLMAAALLVAAVVPAAHAQSLTNTPSCSTQECREQAAANAAALVTSWEQDLERGAETAGQLLGIATELFNEQMADAQQPYGFAVLHAVAAGELCKSESMQKALVRAAGRGRWDAIEDSALPVGVHKVLSGHLMELEMAWSTAFSHGFETALVLTDSGETTAGYCASLEVMIEEKL